MIYLLIFSVSLFFIFIGLKQSNKKIGNLCIFIGLIIPCIFAGIRNINVGTDTKGYVFNVYNLATESQSFSTFLSSAARLCYVKDFMYLLVSYVIGHNNLSFQLLLFFYQCLIIFPVYFSLKINKRKNEDIIFGMAIFFLAFYNLSLNMVRQSIAISFILLSFSLFTKESSKKSKGLSLLFFLLAIGFHDTALVALPIYIYYFICNHRKITEKQKTIFSITIVIIFLLAVIFHRQILLFIGNSGIYPKAINYLKLHSKFDIDISGSIINLSLIIWIISGKKYLKEQNSNYKFALFLSLINFILFSLSAFITYSQRIAYYSYFIIISNYISILSYEKNSDNTIYSKKDLSNKLKPALIFLLFLTYWFIVIVINNSNETLPYVLFK